MEKRTDIPGIAQSGTKNVFLRMGKYTLAAFEYAALASFGVIKAGGNEIINLAVKLNPAPPLSMAVKKIFGKKADNIENIQTALEQRIAILEERLIALEQQRACIPENIASQKKAIQKEKRAILKQLIDINKSLKE